MNNSTGNPTAINTQDGNGMTNLLSALDILTVQLGKHRSSQDILLADLEELIRDQLILKKSSFKEAELTKVFYYLNILINNGTKEQEIASTIKKAFNLNNMQTGLPIWSPDLMQPHYTPDSIISGLNTELKTQNQLIYQNNIENKIFLSLSDICLGTNQLHNLERIGTPDQKKEAEETADNLREILKKDKLCTSTREIYANQGLNGDITHNYQSIIIPPTIKKGVLIPEYEEHTKITDMLRNKNGLKYLQAITGLNGDKKEIIKTLMYIGQVPEDKIWSLTLCNGDRKNNIKPAEKALFLYRDGKDLIIRGHFPGFETGVSLAVKYTPLTDALQKDK